MPIQNLNLSELAKNRLHVHAKKTGLKMSTVVERLIMAHLPKTAADAQAETMLDAAMATVKMPKDWGEAPSWMKD